MAQTPGHPGKSTPHLGRTALVTGHLGAMSAVILIMLAAIRTGPGPRVIQSEHFVGVGWDSRTRSYEIDNSDVDDWSERYATLGGRPPRYPTIAKPGEWPKPPDPIDGRRRGGLVFSVRSEFSGRILPTREQSSTFILPRLAGRAPDDEVLRVLAESAADHLGIELGDAVESSAIPGASQFERESRLLWSGVFGNALGLLAFLTLGGSGFALVRDTWRVLTPRRRHRSLRAGRCPACGYLIINLREQRCPECAGAWSDEEALVIPSAEEQPSPN